MSTCDDDERVKTEKNYAEVVCYQGRAVNVNSHQACNYSKLASEKAFLLSL
jgi:hypothetical protein